MTLPSDGASLVGWLLVAGTVLGLAPVAYPPFLSIWTGTREHHLARVAEHPRAWIALNAGFALATIATAAGITALGVLALPSIAGTVLVALGVAEAMAGTCWVAVVAVRARTTPVLARLAAAGDGGGRAEDLLGAALGGLFGAFIVGAGLVLVGLGVTVGLAGLAPAWLAVAIAVAGAAFVALQLVTGDCIPALLYLPTLVLGIVLLVR